MRLSKGLKLTAFLSISAFLAACGSGGEASNENEAASSNSSDDTLLVYTNSLDDEKEAWLQEKSTEAGFNVEFVIGGGGEIYNRVMAEAGDPQADVLIGMDEGQFQSIQEEDLLIEWEPSWAGDIPDDLKMGGNYFYPWAEQRIFNFVNEGTEVPSDIESMITDSEFQNSFAVPNELGGSTNQKIVFTILLQHLDENGELGVSEEGWNLITEYFENGYMPAEEEDRNATLADGTIKANYYFSGGIPNAEEEFGFKADPINPDYGVFTMSEQVGVVNKPDENTDLAVEYAEWWGSEETQSGWAEEFGTVPALETAQEAVNEHTLELFEQTDRMDVNWDVYNEYSNQWVEKIELDIMPAG